MAKVVFVTDPHLSSRTPVSRIDDYPMTCLTKMDFVNAVAKKENAIVVCGGDFYNTPVQPDVYKNRVIRRIVNSGVIWICIPGNHDIPYYNEEFIDKTSIDNMFASKVLVSLKVPFKYGDWTIYGQGIKEPLPDVTDNKSVIISHCFFHVERDLLNVTLDEARKSRARFLCMGHDHNKYPLVEHDGTLIVRPGALTRGTSSTENQIRTVSIALLDLDLGTAEYIPVPARPYEEIFRYKSVNEKTQKAEFNDIKEFIDRLKESGVGSSPYQLLKSMDINKRIRERVVYYLESAGLYEIQEN